MSSANCVLSIIMPCYNHGAYLEEALDSIVKDKILFPYEVIIVDDGSTDIYTLTKLEEYKEKGYRIIHQKNAGPAAARNTAVSNSSAKYILPLDADNKIPANYINNGIAILEKGEYQIVYGMPSFFGNIEKGSRSFTPIPFNITELLASNYIDNCAIFLREVWVKNKGYDTSIPYFGHEDWEFWINAYYNGYRFYFLKTEVFYYRVLQNSVADQFKENKKVEENRQYILKKHAQLFSMEYLKLNYIKGKYQRDIKRFIFSPFIFLAYRLNIIKTPFKKAEQRFNKTEA